MEKLVRAAGGVVLRGEAGSLEVVVVHRPRYDDWSLPKGKLDPGESFEEAALREVEEETALECRLVRELDSLRYRDAKGRPKLVRYWLMRALRGRVDERPADSEVDRVEWRPVERALADLTYPHDRDLLRAAQREQAPPG